MPRPATATFINAADVLHTIEAGIVNSGESVVAGPDRASAAPILRAIQVPTQITAVSGTLTRVGPHQGHSSALVSLRILAASLAGGRPNTRA